MTGVPVYRFGPFEFDPAKRLLLHDQKRVRLSDPMSAILAHLCAHPGAVIPKETLIDAGWGGMAINENSVDQAISRLRRRFGETRRTATYIETLPHEGYRFKAPVQQARGTARVIPDARLEEELAPFRALVEGQMELFTLGRDAIQRARRAFERALHEAPDYAPAHVGLAMACALSYETTSNDVHADDESLRLAIDHALRATALAPKSAHAWGARAFVNYLSGDGDDAAAATHLAVSLEPENWLHALRGAYVTWGEQRRAFAQRVVTLSPGMALPHWLIATVFIARGAFEPAFEHLRIGCAAQDAQTGGEGLTAVGLHLLHGLALAAHDRLDEAEAELRRELPWVESDHLWARECAANTWYALGAVCLRQQKRQEAEAAFARALAISPRHVSALAALRGEVPRYPPSAFAKATADKKGGLYIGGNPAEAGLHMDAAIAQAIVLARGNRHAEAARVYADAVARMPPGRLGWMLPVEPLLHPLAHREEWDEALSRVRARAT